MPHLLSRLLGRKSNKERDPRQSESSGARSPMRRPPMVVRSMTWAGHVDESSTDDFEEAFLTFLNQPQPLAPRVAAGITEEDQEDYAQFTLAAKVDWNLPRRPAASAGARRSSKSAEKTIDDDTADTEDQESELEEEDGTPRNESFDSGICVASMDPSLRKRGGSDDSLDMTTWLPSEIWEMVANYLPPSTAAALTVTSRRMFRGLGNQFLDALKLETNREERSSFLYHMEEKLPSHTLCWACGVYHARQDSMNERLGVYESTCPQYHPDSQCLLSRDRLVPWDLVNLATRSARYTPAHGIPTSALGKKWTSESGWKHSTRGLLVDGQLLLKVSSLSWVEPYMSTSELRVVVDERYHERFSHCKHLGNALDKYAKCAVGHIRPGYQVTAQCATCRVLRRCHQCPSEYLIEIKLVEDRAAARTNTYSATLTTPALPQFRHALCVTRWSDLGDGSAPHTSLEWSAAASALSEPWAASKPGFWGSRTVRSRFERCDGNRVPEVPAHDLKNSMRWQLARLEREREETRQRQVRASDLESERRRMRLFLAYSRANTEPVG